MAAEPKFSVRLGKRINKLVGQGNFRETAAAACGIAARTLRIWLRKGANGEEPFATFMREQDEAESAAEKRMLEVVKRQGAKDWRALAWILERRGAKRWGFRASVEVSVQEELERILNVIERELGSEAASRVFAALADGDAGEGPPAGPAPASGDTRH